METLISIPISLGSERSLHIQQKQKSSSFLGTLQSLVSGAPSGAIHVQNVPAGAGAVVEVCGQPTASHDVRNNSVDKTQTIVVNTVSAEPLQIYLRWPKGAEEVGLDQLKLQSSDYHIKWDIETPNVPAGAKHLSPADVDFRPARELLVASTSGGISGLIPMMDLLNVSTSSGTADITLLPLYYNKSAAHETKLSIKSNSGSLSINSKLDAAAAAAAGVHSPGRDCHVSIQSSSGTIRSVLGMTKLTSIKSSSGSQHLTALLRDLSLDRRSDLATTTTSGSQNITIVAAPDEDKTAGAAEKAGKAGEVGYMCRHKSSSGSVWIAYPGVWEGTVEAHSNSASIAVTGEGVETDRVRNTRTAVKGTPVHHTDVDTSWGAVSVRFGEA
ncbi:hypothetical protein ISF_08402 [Cordyceps fumosorosea ARSEF 2679]|uniref:Uncharacterized protein n=1 Tax=Cordyceps fumosorosea (strain ARSEF 2679) TaxID=1081104 RepID=A0A162I9T6_CORFA|nr:hypothetical protein ISF_08402 [Cordyceps fumosorosea ARSEF 2679]OAA54175.1 hypothetical protein ISF_08402 [Cordyceps fumosorosea ARSEF 2679]